jgi:hypothetical protein
MIRAVALVWLFAGIRGDEIRRLRVGCVRWQPDNESSVCFLDVPVNKTETAFTKPVDVVGQAINAWENDEWQSKTEWHRVVAFNRLGESIADTLHKGDHVLVDGQLVSSKYEHENGKSKKAKAAQFNVFWSARELRAPAQPCRRRSAKCGAKQRCRAGIR